MCFIRRVCELQKYSILFSLLLKQTKQRSGCKLMLKRSLTVNATSPLAWSYLFGRFAAGVPAIAFRAPAAALAFARLLSDSCCCVAVAFVAAVVAAVVFFAPTMLSAN